MHIALIGLGLQGRKRLALLVPDVVATVDPVAEDATHLGIENVPIDSYDCGIVCTPDHTKVEIIEYLIENNKHVLVEKPLICSDPTRLRNIDRSASEKNLTIYTAYNHRFEPNLLRLKQVLDKGDLGSVYTARIFYGNGTAADVRESLWRDTGVGVLSDLGSHLLDLVRYLFGDLPRQYKTLNLENYENRSPDHVITISPGTPLIELEATLLSWRNTFLVDIICEFGSVHMEGLSKWGPSTLKIRRRVYPSGIPEEIIETANGPDMTFDKDYRYFLDLIGSGFTSIESDISIMSDLNQMVLSHELGENP